MEWLQSVLDNGTAPALTAFILGLLTAISPCPLATNIAAIGFIGKHIEERKVIFIRGLCYALGRVIAYTVLGIVLISVLKGGASMFGIQRFVSRWGELLLGPLLLVIGLFMLFGHRLSLPRLGIGGGERGKRLVGKGSWGALLLGVLFAMAFCPSSGVLYFGVLIPLSVTASAGWLYLIVFAVATSLPVLFVAWVLAFSVLHIGTFYGKMQRVQYGLNLVVGLLFLMVGAYYCCVMYL